MRNPLEVLREVLSHLEEGDFYVEYDEASRMVGEFRDSLDDLVPLELLSEALDEIYRLRQLCAYEHEVRRVDLSYKTYPKSRRSSTEALMAKLKLAAQGKADVATADISWPSLRHCMGEVGMPTHLTRADWEAHVDSRRRPKVSST